MWIFIAVSTMPRRMSVRRRVLGVAPGVPAENEAASADALRRGQHGRLHARAQPQLAQHMLHVDLHRGLGDAQVAGDLLVAGAARDAAQDVTLARRQARRFFCCEFFVFGEEDQAAAAVA
jgi:hypothetical protein